MPAVIGANAAPGGAMRQQRIADRVAIRPRPRRCPASMSGRAGERRAVLDPGDEILRGAQRETIAADADNAGRRAVDGEHFRFAVDAARIAGVDAAVGIDFSFGVLPRSAPGGKGACGTIGPESASVPAGVRATLST